MSPPREADVAVIGAGAAGLAAAREAKALGLSVAVIEAKDRIGGRAHTDTTTLGLPWDRGAMWMQNAARNPFVAEAERLGFAYHDSPARSVLWNRRRWADDALRHERDAYCEAAFDAIARAGAAGFDGPASEVMPRDPRFQAMFDSWFAALVGVEPERVSAIDYARFEYGDVSYPLADGYGALLARVFAEVEVALSTPATLVRWGGRGVAVETPRGTLRARAAIVTLSTSLLAAGALAFDPPLPEETRTACAAVPLGEAEKVALAFSRDVFGIGDHLQLHLVHDTRESARFQLRYFGRNLAIAYFAGSFARELAAAGEDAMIDFARERLTEVFGADIVKALTGAAATRWSFDPNIGGAYSCALPGHASAREALSRPIAERLFLAGEACSLDSYGTVHGAHASGIDAARAVVKRIGAGKRMA